MPFLILSCGGDMPPARCEERIRELLQPYGEVMRLIMAENPPPRGGWTALVELDRDAEPARHALAQTQIDGSPVRIREPRPINITQLLNT